MNIPKAVKNILKNKNKMCIINESPYGNSETRYSDNVVKYPNKIQLINWSSLFLWNLDRNMKNWIKTNVALKTKVVIPMSIFVINAKEYDIELMGVVPSVDMIEKDTPTDMTNNPKTNMQILLNIFKDKTIRYKKLSMDFIT